MNEARKFRKKPVVIEAMQLTEEESSVNAISAWAQIPMGDISIDDDGRWVVNIHTLEGTMTAVEGDWIIKGVQGEFYPCKPDIFAATYEEAADAD